MIIVVSDVIDESTNSVIDWMIQHSKVIRINKDDIDIISINYADDEICVNF